SSMTLPAHCVASAAVAVGATVAATQLHSNSKVPKSCIASGIAGTASVATLIAHHGSLSKPPAWYCVAGGAAGVAGIGYALSAHTELSKIPCSCKMYTAGALVLIVLGAALLGKK
ncbi:MAG: hypothetical protein SGPRY_009047, partial [Prymnesium sp.]